MPWRKQFAGASFNRAKIKLILLLSKTQQIEFSSENPQIQLSANFPPTKILENRWTRIKLAQSISIEDDDDDGFLGNGLIIDCANKKFWAVKSLMQLAHRSASMIKYAKS